MVSSVPRLLRLEVTKQWTRHAWSPQDLLAGDFMPKSLTVKRSRHRFFMYEEHAPTKLKDDTATQVLERSPKEFIEMLYNQEGNFDKHHTYWTSPINDIAPDLLKRVPNYESLHDDDTVSRQPKPQLDPRGPSLWMGTSGSATQAHYDVADNVIVQLYGSKRIRCYAPDAFAELYVFPDAHPRARKSQVNFDQPDYDRFPQFASLLDPVMDVVLQPGDAIAIPAFWFHHVENGRLPNSASIESNDLHSIGADEPSVSLNVFALSKSMMTAQGIFRDASRPLGFLAVANNESEQYEFAVAALHALGWGLFEGLGLQGTPRAYIQTHLFDRRYTSLDISTTRNGNSNIATKTKSLTASEQEKVSLCIERLLPQFEALKSDGISSLVFCHLLELWAVEFVGAPSVADAWEAVLLLDDHPSVAS
jgi:hypothetical protein